jgi:outer membrane lipoprotein-sorting protein
MYALAVLLLTLITCFPSNALAVEKMKAEDVVAKHLESIGSAAARSAARSRVVVGTTRATFRARNSSGAIDGRAVLGSINQKVMFGMGFTAPNYPGEKFGFDGKRFTVGYLTPGIRSTLGNFLLIHSDVFKEGLMGGTLSSAWPLLDLAERGAKLEYAGTEKIGDLPVHKLEYSPKKGSELRIMLYFDAKTFEHVRTQYDRVIAARLGAGGIDNQARQMETRYKMIENYSAYRKEGELNLPHSYTLQLEITKTNGSSSDKWETEFSQFVFNQEIDDAGFNVEVN